MAKVKSLMERVNDIEVALSKKDEGNNIYHEPNISEMIGEDFRAYFNKSKIFTYQTDEYDLKRDKKQYIINLVFSYIFLVSILVLFFYILFKYKKFEVYTLVFSILILIITVLKQIRFIKYPDRLPIKSFFCTNKYNMYLSMDQLKVRYAGTGGFNKVIVAYIILGILVFIFSWLAITDIIKNAEFSIFYLFYGFLFHFIIISRKISINYDCFVFDAGDSIVMCDTRLKRFVKYDV